MEQTVLRIIQNQGETMSDCGYYEGVIATMWAEIAVAQSQADQAVSFFWQLRRNLGAEQ